MYNASNQIKFKTSMIRSNLCDYSNAYTHVKGTITVPHISAQGAAPNNRNKVIFKNCAPFINCINEINDTQVDNAHDIDVVMLMYNLLKYTSIYSKTPVRLWQYCRNEPALNNHDVIIDFPADNNNNISLELKEKIIEKTENNSTKDVEIMG